MINLLNNLTKLKIIQSIISSKITVILTNDITLTLVQHIATSTVRLRQTAYGQPNPALGVEVPRQHQRCIVRLEQVDLNRQQQAAFAVGHKRPVAQRLVDTGEGFHQAIAFAGKQSAVRERGIRQRARSVQAAQTTPQHRVLFGLDEGTLEQAFDDALQGVGICDTLQKVLAQWDVFDLIVG